MATIALIIFRFGVLGGISLHYFEAAPRYCPMLSKRSVAGNQGRITNLILNRREKPCCEAVRYLVGLGRRRQLALALIFCGGRSA
jgi:hypothetical protein